MFGLVTISQHRISYITFARVTEGEGILYLILTSLEHFRQKEKKKTKTLLHPKDYLLYVNVNFHVQVHFLRPHANTATLWNNSLSPALLWTFSLAFFMFYFCNSCQFLLPSSVAQNYYHAFHCVPMEQALLNDSSHRHSHELCRLGIL